MALCGGQSYGLVDEAVYACRLRIDIATWLDRWSDGVNVWLGMLCDSVLRYGWMDMTWDCAMDRLALM